MKIIIALLFAGFLGISVYQLIKEKPQPVSTKVPAMLERERTGKISIVDFKASDKGVEYKISEEQLDEFGKQVKDLKEKHPAK